MSDQDAIEAVTLPVAALEVPHMVAALARWRDACRRSLPSGLVAVSIPSEQQAVLLVLVESAPHTGLTDVLHEPLDFRVRHVGAEIVAAQGVDLTGRRVSKLEPRRFIGLIMQTFAAVVAGREPVLHRVLYRHGEQRLDYLRLLLPLSDDGRNVKTIWAVTRYGEGLEQFPAG